MARDQLDPALRVRAVAAACLAIVASSATAQSSCPAHVDNTITVIGAVAGPCRLDAGISLNVTHAGGITVTGMGTRAVAVIAESAGNINNSGSIAGARGIHLDAASNNVSMGDITNHGTIAGGIFLDASINDVSVGNILYSETGITTFANAITAYVLTGNNVSVGNIINRGTMSYGTNTINLNANGGTITVASLINSGTISGYAGIRVLNRVTIAGGIHNLASGVIRSDSVWGAIFITGNGSIDIHNSGTIEGRLTFGKALNLNGSSGRITGTVTGHRDAGSVVNVNGTFTTENTFYSDHFNIASGAVLNMRHLIRIWSAAGLVNAGTLSVPAGTTAPMTGNYVQAATGVYETAVSSASNYGKLAISRTADLSASNRLAVKLSRLHSLTNGAVLTDVLRATAGLTAGALSVTDDHALWRFSAARNGNGIDLTAHAVSTETMIRNTGIGLPALGAARVIDRFLEAGSAPGNMQTVLNGLAALATDEQGAAAVAQMVPLHSGGMTHTSLQALHGIQQVVQQRLDAPRGLPSGDSVTERQLWIKPFGSWADQNDRDGVTGYDASIHGLVLGADAAVSGQTRAGAAFAYANSHVNTSSALVVHRAKVDSYQAIMYGSHRLDLQTEVNFQADVGSNKTGGSRLINFGGISRTAASAYRSWSAHLGAGISRRLAVGATTNFTPSLRADYTTVRDRGYTETGADALNLKVNRKSAEELTLLGGGKLSHALSEATRLTANLGIGYDALAHRSLITSSFAGGGAAFTTEGIRPSPWLARGGLALLVDQVNGVEVTAGYDLEVRKGFTNQTASVKFRLPF